MGKENKNKMMSSNDCYMFDLCPLFRDSTEIDKDNNSHTFPCYYNVAYQVEVLSEFICNILLCEEVGALS